MVDERTDAAGEARGDGGLELRGGVRCLAGAESVEAAEHRGVTEDERGDLRATELRQVNGKDVRAEVIHVDGTVRGERGDVEKRPGAGAGADGLDDVMDGCHGAKQLMRGGKGHEARGAIDKLRVLEGGQLAGAKIRLGPAHGRAMRTVGEGGVERRRVELGQHHRGLAAQERAEGAGERLVEHGQGGAEHDGIGTRAHEIGDGHAGGLKVLLALKHAGDRGCGMGAHGGICRQDGIRGAEGAGDAGGNLLRNLRRGVRVEVRPAVSESRI